MGTRNDRILLDQILSQEGAARGSGLDESEFFEIFAAEQILKDEDLGSDEIQGGLVGGPADGGVDALYFFVNGVLQQEDSDLSQVKRNAVLRVVIIQSKTTDSFSEESMNKLRSSVADLFDFTKPLDQLASVYNERLLRKTEAFRDAWLQLAQRFPRVRFDFYYAAKAEEAHPNVERKVAEIETAIRSCFDPVEFEFEFLGASELLARARETPDESFALEVSENPVTTGQQGYLCLVKLKEYFRFVSDDKGRLRFALFEGNVRDYMGDTEVNEEIHATLSSGEPEDFWWLNNGISIICSNASLSGKTLTVEHPEIVNGLQTSREIHAALSSGVTRNENKNLLVRVLRTVDSSSRDRIIKATNSQNPMPIASLRATEKIHRDIEEYVGARGLFYDRRKNFYKNAGRQLKSIIGIPVMAQAIMACYLQEPATARARPSSLLKEKEDYRRVFSEDYPIELYYACVSIVRKVDAAIDLSSDPAVKKAKTNIRFYVAYLLTARLSGTSRPRPATIAQIDAANISSANVNDAIRDVFTVYTELGASDQVAKGVLFKERVDKKFLTPQNQSP